MSRREIIRVSRLTDESWTYNLGGMHTVQSITTGVGIALVFDAGDREMNGHILAASLDLAKALAALTTSAAPALGDDHADVVRGRELVAALVQERLK